jgi:hypothetical protein
MSTPISFNRGKYLHPSQNNVRWLLFPIWNAQRDSDANKLQITLLYVADWGSVYRSFFFFDITDILVNSYKAEMHD